MHAPHNSEQWSFAAFQKLQFLERFLDLHYAMFKIKSLQYKDLILNSTGCRKSNRLLRQPFAPFIRSSAAPSAGTPRNAPNAA